MPTIQELYTSRHDLIRKAQEIRSKLTTEKREEPNAEERQQIDAMLMDAERIQGEITLAEKLEADHLADQERRSKLDALASLTHRNDNRRSAPPAGRGAPAAIVRAVDTEEYRGYYEAQLRRDPNAAFRHQSALEARALSLGTTTAGGFMALPTALMNELIGITDELCDIRKKARVINIGDAKSLGITKRTTRGDDADWTTEVQSTTADTNLAIGRRDFTPFLLTKEILESLVFMSRVPESVAYVQREMARLFAITQEKAFLTGTGSGQPLGAYVASSSGISTARDIIAASTTVWTWRELTRVKYSLKASHLRNAEWNVHRDFMMASTTLLDSQNRPIFIPSSDPKLADTLLGLPVNYSEFAPNTFTAALYAAVLGDWSNYVVVDAMSYSVQVLDQIAARTNQVSFIGRAEIDGAPILEEAFARLQLHA